MLLPRWLVVDPEQELELARIKSQRLMELGFAMVHFKQMEPMMRQFDQVTSEVGQMSLWRATILMPQRLEGHQVD